MYLCIRLICFITHLAVVNNPTESTFFWDNILRGLKRHVVKEIGLFVSDGLSEIETVIQRNFPHSKAQLCCIHLMRDCQKYAKPYNKQEMAENLKNVFVTDTPHDSISLGLERWKRFCIK